MSTTSRAGGAVLEARIGNVPGASMRLRAVDKEVTGRAGKRVVDVTVSSFERAAITLSGAGHNHTLVIEPGDAEEVVEYGPFFVRGNFRVVAEERRPRAAAMLFKGFEPA